MVSGLSESIREKCRLMYGNYKDVPAESCMKCSERAWCGKIVSKEKK
jgi:hypothetical protein